MILCSECYDRSAHERFTGIIPRSTCADCGRLCLGYAVESEHHDDEAHHAAITDGGTAKQTQRIDRDPS